MEQTTIKINWERMSWDVIYRRQVISELKFNLERTEKTDCESDEEMTGKIDIDRITTGISNQERSKIGIVREVVIELESVLGKTIPLDDLFEKCQEKGISDEEIKDALDKLKRTGDFFEPKKGFISKI